VDLVNKVASHVYGEGEALSESRPITPYELTSLWWLKANTIIMAVGAIVGIFATLVAVAALWPSNEQPTQSAANLPRERYIDIPYGLSVLMNANQIALRTPEKVPNLRFKMVEVQSVSAVRFFARGRPRTMMSMNGIFSPPESPLSLATGNGSEFEIVKTRSTNRIGGFELMKSQTKPDRSTATLAR